MRQDDSIEILKPNQSKNGKGIVITQFTHDETISCNWQPLKYNVQYKVYGITDKTSDMILLKNSELMQRYNLPKDDPNQFNAAYRINYNGNQYIIDAILPYKKHMEIYVEKVI